MGSPDKTFREAATQLVCAWRAALPFFMTLELWLMVVVSAATVGGFWLAMLGDAWSLAAFGFAIAYCAARTVLHLKRIVSWPFLQP